MTVFLFWQWQTAEARWKKNTENTPAEQVYKCACH